jgi:hypothetical protein
MEVDFEEPETPIKKSGWNFIIIIIIILAFLLWKIITGAITPETFFNLENFNTNFLTELKNIFVNNIGNLTLIFILIIATIVLRRSNQRWTELQEQEQLKKIKKEENLKEKLDSKKQN